MSETKYPYEVEVALDKLYDLLDTYEIVSLLNSSVAIAERAYYKGKERSTVPKVSPEEAIREVIGTFGADCLPEVLDIACERHGLKRSDAISGLCKLVGEMPIFN